eukprot:scaffold1008_cov124-Cylindrotheca_fusiformis.AAC.1
MKFQETKNCFVVIVIDESRRRQKWGRERQSKFPCSNIISPINMCDKPHTTMTYLDSSFPSLRCLGIKRAWMMETLLFSLGTTPEKVPSGGCLE